jgi:hypothetical protein
VNRRVAATLRAVKESVSVFQREAAPCRTGQPRVVWFRKEDAPSNANRRGEESRARALRRSREDAAPPCHPTTTSAHAPVPRARLADEPQQTEPLEEHARERDGRDLDAGAVAAEQRLALDRADLGEGEARRQLLPPLAELRVQVVLQLARLGEEVNGVYARAGRTRARRTCVAVTRSGFGQTFLRPHPRLEQLGSAERRVRACVWQ